MPTFRQVGSSSISTTLDRGDAAAAETGAEGAKGIKGTKKKVLKVQGVLKKGAKREY